MKLYLAGPMRGRPEMNFPAFFSMAAKLEKEGYIVFNPAAKGEEKNVTNEEQFDLAFRRKVFALDTEFICKEADGIFMLKDWEQSRGAVAEKALADAIGLPVFYEGPHINV
jgi:hypothetical protein